jgi:hypothetical protein
LSPFVEILGVSVAECGACSDTGTIGIRPPAA